MEEATIDKIRPVYSELKGMLSQAPAVETILHSSDQGLWDRFNLLLEKLTEITQDEGYKEFTLTPKYTNGFPSIPTSTYRSRLSGPISRLHGTFFTQDPEPFSGSPSTVVSQTNSQTTNTQLYIQLGIELKTALDNAKDENEKSFIKAVMEKVGTVKTYIEFLTLVTNTAGQFGIALDRISTIFGN